MENNAEREPQDDLVEVVSPLEAQHWLGISGATYNALVKSGLLGRVTEANEVFWEDLWHYDRFGTVAGGKPPEATYAHGSGGVHPEHAATPPMLVPRSTRVCRPTSMCGARACPP
jgi:hypothetical protein